MTEELKQQLQSWSSLKNWHMSHPSDEELFFKFIISAYNENKENGKGIDIDEFIQIVKVASDKYQITDSQIEKEYSNYELCFSLLKYLKI